jgi:hypothetical protein
MSDMTILQQVPEKCDISASYLFYLHGLIVEEAGIRPKSEEHGYYEYQLILEELARHGFVVISEARPSGTQVKPYAELIAAQINALLRQGVAAGRISVVGASKGGVIGAYVANILKHREINYVILSGLFEKCLVDQELKLYGRVLSIHDRADKLSIVPEQFFQRSRGLGEFRQILVDRNLGHGLIYKPYPEWLEPLRQWLKAR